MYPVILPTSRTAETSSPCQLQQGFTGRLHRSFFREAFVITQLHSICRVPPQNQQVPLCVSERLQLPDIVHGLTLTTLPLPLRDKEKSANLHVQMR